MTKRVVILRIAKKHINVLIRLLEMKRKEMSELAGLMMFGVIKKEIVKEKSLERWARRCSNFAKKVKRMLFEEIDNMVWSGNEKEIAQWCKNKVYHDITAEEIEEILMREDPDEDEPIRLNGKYV